MAFDYAPIAAVSQSLILKFAGQGPSRTVTFVELGDVPADPSKPYLGSASPRGAPKQTLALPAVFVEPSSLQALGRGVVSDDFLKRSTQIALVYSSVALQPFDEVIDIDTSRWKIADLSELKPGGISLLWFVGLKR